MYDAESFGNYVGVLESEYFRIRITRDRGDIYIDLASLLDPERWFNIDRLLSIVRPDRRAGLPLDERTLEDGAILLKENYERLSGLLGSEHYAETKRSLEALGNMVMGRFRRLSARRKKQDK